MKVNEANGYFKIVYALLDTGSDCDMIDVNIVKNMDTIEMHVVENITTKKRPITSFSLQSTKNAFESTMENVIIGKIHSAAGGSGITPISKTSVSTNSTPDWG